MRTHVFTGVALAVGLLAAAPRAALALCDGDPNKEPCGEFCIAAGRVCCESIGHPELSCPGGTRCEASDLRCYDVCDEGAQQCGNGCFNPSTHTCCADAGHPELTCSIDHICTAAGGCEPLDGGGCAASPVGGSTSDPRALIAALLCLGAVLLARGVTRCRP